MQQLRSTEGLEKLYSLEQLDLSHNRLTEYEEVSRIASLPCLTTLKLEGNPIAKLQKYRITVLSMLRSNDSSSNTKGSSAVALDGKLPSLRERRALKDLQFVAPQVCKHCIIYYKTILTCLVSQS
jgi:Leucine-rich repeat (LRR) protein